MDKDPDMDSLESKKCCGSGRLRASRIRIRICK